MESENSVNEEDVSTIKLLPNEGEVSGNISGDESDGTVSSDDSLETFWRKINHKKV